MPHPLSEAVHLSARRSLRLRDCRISRRVIGHVVGNAVSRGGHAEPAVTNAVVAAEANAPGCGRTQAAALGRLFGAIWQRRRFRQPPDTSAGRRPHCVGEVAPCTATRARAASVARGADYPANAPREIKNRAGRCALRDPQDANRPNRRAECQPRQSARPMPSGSTFHVEHPQPGLISVPMSSARAGRAAQSRIGITTNLVAPSPGARIRQLLLASVTPISTVSASTAASASSR